MTLRIARARWIWPLASAAAVACGAFGVDDDAQVQPVADAAATDDAFARADAETIADAETSADAETPLVDAALEAAVIPCMLLPSELNLLDQGALETAHWPVNGLTFRENQGLIALTDTEHPGDVVARCVAPKPHAMAFGIRVEYEVNLLSGPINTATLLRLGSWNGDATTIALTVDLSSNVYLDVGGTSYVGSLAPQTTIVIAAQRDYPNANTCVFMGSREAAANACVTLTNLRYSGSATTLPIDVDYISIGLNGPGNGARTVSRRLSVRALPAAP